MTEPYLEAVAHPAAPALQPFVDGYGGYDMRGFAPGTHQGLPSRYLTFIISLDDAIDVEVMPDPRQRPGRFQAVLSGLADAPATIRHDGNQRGVHVDLTPAGARALFGLPAGELAFGVLELEDLAGSVGRELVERVLEAPDWHRRFAALDAVLTRMRTETRPPPAEVERAWDRIVRSGGQVAVAELAAEVGWSRRHLGERFRGEYGLSPKVAARVVRFERSRRLVERGDRTLADVAADCGYYDQAHLARDWRELAGASPSAWLAEELPSVQDNAVALGAR